MQITKISLLLPKEKTKRLRAFVTIKLDDTLIITDIKLFQKLDGTYYLDFPSTDRARKMNEANIYLTSTLRRIITDAVLEQYKNKLAEGETE